LRAVPAGAAAGTGTGERRRVARELSRGRRLSRSHPDEEATAAMKILHMIILATVLLTGIGASAAPGRPILIRGARVFDGSGAPAVVENILIRGDRIVAVGRRIHVP